MPQTKYSVASPYYHTEVRDFYLDAWTPIEIEPDPSDKLVEIHSKHNERPDLMAYDAYGNPELWWIFAIRNKDILIDPVGDFKAGVKIYVPDPRRVT